MPAVQQQVAVANMTTFRAAKAKRIKELLEAWAENSIALGVELKAVRKSFPGVGAKDAHSRPHRPGWAEWLKAETGMDIRHANALISVSDRFAGRNIRGLSHRVLRLLAAKTTPPSAEKEIIDRSRKGERLGHVKAKAIIDSHRPSPAKANAIAKETGKPQLASDGFLYLGASQEAVKESTERRTVVYAVRRAIETLATVEITPTELLDWALPHQLWNKREENQITDAVAWLNALNAAWKRRK